MAIEPQAEPSAARATPQSQAFIHLLASLASWFGFWGMQMVIFQWLVVRLLEAPATQVGAAQMALTVPSLLLLLVGGAIADRFDPRALLVGVHLGAAAIVVALCLVVFTGSLSYEMLIGYALAVGTLQAFSLPSRDTLLSDVVAGGMSRAVAGLTMTQHAAQTLGAFVAGSASWVGPVPVLALQATVLLAGAFPVARLPRRPRRQPGHTRPLAFRELGAGIVEVMRSDVLRPVMVMAVTTGICFVGPFLVILPLLVRDSYGGGALEMGILSGMFPLGAVLGGAVIVWRGGLEGHGRALALGQITAATAIAAIGLGLPFSGSVIAVLCWGVSGALFINAGRTLFQQHASQANRARVLSVYTLGILGGAPLGSLLSGFLADRIGLHATLLLAAAVVFTVTLTVVSFMRLLRLR